jgi:hypothetical protein
MAHLEKALVEGRQKKIIIMKKTLDAREKPDTLSVCLCVCRMISHAADKK